MKQLFFGLSNYHPIIAAVKDEQGLHHCCASEDIQVVFVLYGDVCSICEIVRKIKDAGKLAIVHADLISGLAAKEISVDYLKTQAMADGIISTKPSMIRRAKELSMFTVMRFFVLDSISLSNIEKQLGQLRPDYIEILPGILPRIISHLTSVIRLPIIAGGLISEKEDVVQALSQGAVAVSSSNENVWIM